MKISGSISNSQIEETLLVRLAEQNNQLISLQLLLYALTDLIVEKGIINKEDLENMLDDKIKKANKLVEQELKFQNAKKISEGDFMIHFGEPGQA